MSALNHYSAIPSPSNTDLDLVLFVGNEGITTQGVRVFEGVVTARELVDNFSIEASSLVIPEHQKCQRDLEKARAKQLYSYFEMRDDTVLPSLTIFVSEVINEEFIRVGHRDMITLTVPALSDRLVADGQNRLTLYKSLLELRPELETQTLNVKFIVSDTPTLEPVKTVIRQLFSDFHFKLKKPTASQNLYFDSAEPYSVLMRRFLDIALHGQQLMDFVSVTGKIKNTQLMQLKQLQDFLNTATASTAAKTNAALKANPEQMDDFFALCQPFLTQFFTLLPLHQLSKLDKESMMFSKAIFWQGVAWLIRSLMEDAITQGCPVDWSKLNGLADLPLFDMTHEYWVNAKVVLIDEDEQGNISHKMLKGSEKALGRALCRQLRVFYCEQLG